MIDEYDAGINSALIDIKNADEIKKIIKLFGGIMGSVLKDNKDVAFGMITDVHRLAKENLFSGLNNLSEYNILSN